VKEMERLLWNFMQAAREMATADAARGVDIAKAVAQAEEAIKELAAALDARKR
jgi:hypothetical protein